MKDQGLRKGDRLLQDRVRPHPQRAQFPPSLQRALDGFCDASCNLAEQRITEGRYADAENTLRVVLDERYDPLARRRSSSSPGSKSRIITTRPSLRNSAPTSSR